jgi:hypothetical protein
MPGVHQAKAVPKESAWNNPTRLNSVEAGTVGKIMMNTGFRPVLNRVNLGTKFAAAANAQLDSIENTIRNNPNLTMDQLAPTIEAAMAEIANAYNPGYALKSGEKDPRYESLNAQLSEFMAKVQNASPAALPGIIQGYRKAVNTTVASYMDDVLRQSEIVRQQAAGFKIDPNKAISPEQIEGWKAIRQESLALAGNAPRSIPVTEKLPTAKEIGLPAGWGEPEYRRVNGVRTLVIKDPSGVYHKLEKGGQ